MKKDDLPAIKRFTDHEIGQGYYSQGELEDVYRRSLCGTVMCSLVLVDGAGEICGMRLTYPPGQWKHGKGKGLQPEKWPHELSETAYFQSLFLASSLQGEGWAVRCRVKRSRF